MRKVRVRRGSAAVWPITREEFAARVRQRFDDPRFAAAREHLDALIEIAWNSYCDDRKSPRRRRAGARFAQPEFELPVEWLEARRRIRAAERRQRDPRSPHRILIVNGSARSDQTCPGEVSKTYRLAQMAARVVRGQKRFACEILDLSRLAAEYGRVIYPCKGCVSTAMPLCHWPCSCYPNHGQGQAGDWMNEIYPMWAAAHGVMIVTPVHWYQAPSVLKLMIDRLVCADGGNPDPTTTDGKDPRKAKQIELAGWHFPRHLAGRAFSVVVHGDAAGAENLRRMLCDWLTDMHLVPAGPAALLDRYVGYYRPYATSHDDLDADADLQQEVRIAARTLCAAVRKVRRGEGLPPVVAAPRPK